jgi:hypothetical protein
MLSSELSLIPIQAVLNLQTLKYDNSPYKPIVISIYSSEEVTYYYPINNAFYR